MQVEDKVDEIGTRRGSWIREARPLLPLFTIWGIQWILSAALDIGEEWVHLAWVKQAVLVAALLVSVGILWRGKAKRVNGTGDDFDKESASLVPSSLGLLLLPGLMLIAGVLLLEWIGAVGPSFSPVFRALLLSVGYVIIGSFIGRPFIYLGLWLFVLAGITGVWYLGYAYVVLEGMGGISLLIGGLMLRAWSRS